MTDQEIEHIKANRCPACKNWGFMPGPRGGAGQNLYCCNPHCRAAFNVAPRHNIVIAAHVGSAPQECYPPRVHILQGGIPLCRFHGSLTVEGDHFRNATPDEWPIGHSWVGRDEFESATCTACRSKARS